MKKQQAAQSSENKLSPAAQKALLFCATLIVCTFIYVLVGTRMQSRSAETVILLTPTPALTAAPTQPPGLRPAVVLDRLENAAVTVTELESGAYAISSAADEKPDTMELYLQNGYVRGFSWTLPSIAEKKAVNPNSKLEQETLALLKDERAKQNERIRDLLPMLLNSITPDNYFSPSTCLAWAELAAETNEKGKPAKDEQQDVSFYVFRDGDGRLTLTADLQ
ncbi:MAG: hypothetical protein AAGU77_11065 [Bacillota bacterium]